MQKVMDIDAFLLANEPKSTSNNTSKHEMMRQQAREEAMMMPMGAGGAPGSMPEAQDNIGSTPFGSGVGQVTDSQGNQVDMKQKMRDTKIFTEGIKQGQKAMAQQLQMMKQQKGMPPQGGGM